MTSESASRQLEEVLDLKEYEATALGQLLRTGRTTAPDLADATGIPKARIYGVLESLGDQGFIKIIPGRPKEYEPKSPEEILERAATNARQAYETQRAELEAAREDFVETFGPLYEQASEEHTPTEELFWVVDVGEPSQTETRTLYREAEQSVSVITKSFEYLDAVEPALEDALDRGVDVSALFLHPRHLSAENREIQAEIVDYVSGEYPEIDSRFSNEQLPWRGTIVDPSTEYETGQAIFLVEEHDVPLHMRQAAVTENGSFVAGMQRYFDLIWEYDSVGEDPDAG